MQSHYQTSLVRFFCSNFFLIDATLSNVSEVLFRRSAKQRLHSKRYCNLDIELFLMH